MDRYYSNKVSMRECNKVNMRNEASMRELIQTCVLGMSSTCTGLAVREEEGRGGQVDSSGGRGGRDGSGDG